MPKQVVSFNPALLAEMQAQAPLDYSKAQALADQFDVKVKSIVAKAVREKIPYVKQAKVRKDGKPVASKESTVARIEAAFDFEVGVLNGLEKASKGSLEMLADEIDQLIAQNAVEVE